ncbi:MAG: pitrilysin family protein [bacterium]|jgi:predicted Zn-dependent peptidase
MKHTIEQINLKNGAKGIFIAVPDATVFTYDFNFRAGEYLVDPEKWEIPHLMEHVLLGANQLIPSAKDFHAEIEKNGAYSNASTGIYDISYEVECADFEWDRVLSLLIVAISKPLFLKEEFESEFGNVEEELSARANNHFRRLSIEVRKAVGLKAKSDSDRLKLIKNVSVDDVKEHFKKTHYTGNMRFVLAGNITPGRKKQFIEMLENIELPKGRNRYALPLEKPVNPKKPIYVKNDSVDNLYVYLDTYMTRKLEENESDALDLLITYLTETIYSKILGTARERGILYDMSSDILRTRDATNWWFGAQVSEKNAAEYLDIIISEISKVRRGDISAHDIEVTKQYSLGRYQRSEQTVGGTSAGYCNRYFFEGTLNDYYRIPSRIKAITKDQIVEICNKMFEEKIWDLGVLGNCGEEFVNKLYSQIEVLWN